MRFIILFFLSISIYAQEIILLEENKKVHSTLEGLYYQQDTKEQYNARDILLKNDLIKAKKFNLGLMDGPIWTKVTVKNNSNTTKEMVFYNQRPGINYITTYIYKDNKLIKNIALGDLEPQSKREMLHRFSSFKYQFSPYEEITIVAKVDNYIAQVIGWMVKDPHTFYYNEHILDMLTAFLMGFIFFYILFNLVLYIIYRSRGYLYLIAAIVSLKLYTLSAFGYFYSFDIGLNLLLLTNLAWNSGIAVYVVLIYFPYYFFNMKEKYPKLGFALKSFSALYLSTIILTQYLIYVDESLFIHYEYIRLLYVIAPFILIFTGFYLVYKKEKWSAYFLFAQLLVAYMYLYQVLAHLGGSIKPSDSMQLHVPIAFAIDGVILLTIMYLRNKKEQDDQRLSKDLLLEQSRFLTIGQAIGNIAHQWKMPLSHIGSIVTMLKSTFNHNKPNIEKNLHNAIPQLEESINSMNDTINIFSQYYMTNANKQDFQPYNSLNGYILNMLEAKILLKNVSIDFKFKKEITIHNYEYIFTNIMMILINNSLDAFEKNDANKIEIIISKNKDLINIIYKDNAGGIKIKPIEKAFEHFITTKDKGHGLGLPMVKMLVEDRLEGGIKAKNKDDGLEITISFPI